MRYGGSDVERVAARNQDVINVDKDEGGMIGEVRDKEGWIICRGSEGLRKAGGIVYQAFTRNFWWKWRKIA